MANVLIVQLFMNLFYDSMDSLLEVEDDIKRCKNEYLANYKDESTKVITITYQASITDNTKAIINVQELKKDDDGIVRYVDKTNFEKDRLGDPGSSASLQYIFDVLHDDYNPAIKILSTFDHGYGFIMSRQPTEFDKLKLLLSREHMLDYLKAIRSSDGLQVADGGHFSDDQNKKFSLLEKYLTEHAIEDDLNLELKFTKLQGKPKIIFPSKLRSNYSEADTDNDIVINMKSITALTMNELKKAIEASIFKKFDVIIMMNCFMQTVDTAYTLKDQCDYLLAAETGHWFYGYDYSELMSIGKVDEVFFKRFTDATVNKLRSLNPDSINDLVISCLKLSGTDDFFKTIIDVIKKIITLGQQKKLGSELINARINCRDVTSRAFRETEFNVGLVDFFCLFKNAAAGLKDNELNTLIAKSESTFNSLIKSLYRSDFYLNKPIDFASGLSIFFPGRIKDNTDELDDLMTKAYYINFLKSGAQIQSTFSTESGWGDFLFDYYVEILGDHN